MQRPGFAAVEIVADQHAGNGSKAVIGRGVDDRICTHRNQCRRVVGAVDHHGDVLRHRRSVIVGDGDGVDLSDGLAQRQRLQHRVAVVQREAPADAGRVDGVGRALVHCRQREGADIGRRGTIAFGEARQIGAGVR